MRKRLVIFSFFDKTGYVDDYVIYLLKELVSCTNRLIIVINGSLDERGQTLFAQYSNDVYVRDNTGFDAGAYKYVLCQKLSETEISTYDEILLCNDTFYGPLIPLKDIFSKMENVDCDMWGLNGYFDWAFEHLQSYFLVFRKRIIEEKLLVDYLKQNIDEKSSEINYIYCQFENGLFDYLTRKKGMKYAVYVDNHNYDLYKYSYAYLEELQFPIVKKKTFSFMEENWENIICTLSYIKHKTSYDINLILDSIRRIYGIQIKKDDISEAISCMPPKVTMPMPKCGTSEIEAFIENEKFYIYGAGNYGCNTYWRYAKDKENFQGFIISDGQKKKEESLFGHPVFYFSEVKDIHCCKIVLAMRSELTDKVLENLSDISRVLRIF